MGLPGNGLSLKFVGLAPMAAGTSFFACVYLSVPVFLEKPSYVP